MAAHIPDPLHGQKQVSGVRVLRQLRLENLNPFVKAQPDLLAGPTRLRTDDSRVIHQRLNRPPKPVRGSVWVEPNNLGCSVHALPNL